MTRRRRSLPRRWGGGRRGTGRGWVMGIRMRTRREAAAAARGEGHWGCGVGWIRASERRAVTGVAVGGERRDLVVHSCTRDHQCGDGAFHHRSTIDFTLPPQPLVVSRFPLSLPLLLVCFVLPASALRVGWWIRFSSSSAVARAIIHLPDFTVPHPLVVNRYSCSPHPPCSPAPSSTSVPGTAPQCMP
jgi:hypothetical protein